MAEDRIILQNMTFFGYHGVAPEEQVLGQRFQVDLEATLDLAPAGRTDAVADTMNYQEAFHLVEEIVTTRKFKLIEALAETIAAAVLGRFAVESVVVRIRKPSVPIAGMLDFSAVEIVRRRSG